MTGKSGPSYTVGVKGCSRNSSGQFSSIEWVKGGVHSGYQPGKHPPLNYHRGGVQWTVLEPDFLVKCVHVVRPEICDSSPLLGRKSWMFTTAMMDVFLYTS